MYFLDFLGFNEFNDILKKFITKLEINFEIRNTTLENKSWILTKKLAPHYF